MTRYDPDGNKKRRAKKGERRCDSCAAYLPIPGLPRVCEGRIVGGRDDSDCFCRADDFAGDCVYFGVKQ